MNAQEAIERIGNRLASLEFKKKELVYPMTEEEKYVFLMDVEALSIVLESAKLLHDISDVTPVYGGELKLHSFEMEDYYLDEKTAKSIGIDYETLADGGAEE